MKDRDWYEADVLRADLTIHRHTMSGASEDEIERRLRDRYRDAAAVIVRAESQTERNGEGAWRR